jgi:hypothetical protein
MPRLLRVETTSHRMMGSQMNAKQSVEWELARKTEVLGGNPVTVPLGPPLTEYDLAFGLNLDRRSEMSGTNCLSSGTALIFR